MSYYKYSAYIDVGQGRRLTVYLKGYSERAAKMEARKIFAKYTQPYSGRVHLCEWGYRISILRDVKFGKWRKIK